MKKIAFLLLLLIPFSPFSATLNHADNVDAGNYTIFVVLNSSDCNNCLKHSYSIINKLLEQSNDPRHFIFLMTEKRKESMDIEKAELKELINLQKVTLVWNDDLCSRIRKTAKLENELSSIAIYDDTNNKFIYSSAIKKVTSFDELKAHISK